MGQYQFSMYFKYSFGLLLTINSSELVINIPFIDIHIALSKHAKGTYIFGKEF